MNYAAMTAQELGRGAKLTVHKRGDAGEVFYELALIMLDTIRKNNAEGKNTVMIVPVGPTGQYPIFVRLANGEKLPLDRCWFINMDEYLDDNGQWLDIAHPLSFRGYMEREVYGKLDAPPPRAQRIFPDPNAPERVQEIIDQAGGVDLCVGGVGINGHLAFNEPQPELTVQQFGALTTRVLDIAPETRTANAIGALHGAVDHMPRRCVTIGMRQILAAKKIRLACFRDWHRYVVRRAAYGDEQSSFPVTLLQSHPDAALIITENCAAMPQ